MTQIEIRSRPGVFIKLDEDVAKKIGHWGWCLNKYGYAIAHLPGSGHKGKIVQLSRAVVWALSGEWPDEGLDVDHIFHDKLDNRLEKLRVVPKSINQRNRLKHEGASSKKHGVFWNKRDQRWQAQVGVSREGKGNLISSSYTTDEVLAARCADCMRDLIGGWLPRNFHEESFGYKWERIGEEQRKQILHSLEKNGVSYDEQLIRGIGV